jgi:hypothetical protein
MAGVRTKTVSVRPAEEAGAGEAIAKKKNHTTGSGVTDVGWALGAAPVRGQAGWGSFLCLAKTHVLAVPVRVLVVPGPRAHLHLEAGGGMAGKPTGLIRREKGKLLGWFSCEPVTRRLLRPRAPQPCYNLADHHHARRHEPRASARFVRTRAHSRVRSSRQENGSFRK